MNSLRFLLVHSDARQAEGIAAVLSDARHTVTPTSGLDEAAEALTVEWFDAVLLESAFEPRGLLEFSAKLRTMEDSRRFATRVPLIALNGAGSIADTAFRFDAVMPDPIDPEALTKAVGRLANAVGGGAGLEQSLGNYDDLPVIEAKKFEEQVGGDPDLMVEIIDLFLDERSRQEPELLVALHNGDLDTASKVAHTIKGSLSSLYALKARQRSEALELAARNFDHPTSCKLQALLEADLAELEPVLLSMRRDASSQ